jgi:alkyldihydroxyacetonephosphate synthase
MIKDMKWWGWGDPAFSYPIDEKPLLWPFIRKSLGLSEDCRKTPPVDRASIRLPEARTHAAFMQAIGAALKPEQIAAGDEQRLIHTYGKSFPDLYRVRRGIVSNAPDLVLFPEKHADVEAIVSAAKAHGVRLVAFGGGTNIVGGVEHLEANAMRVTVDMRRMSRVLSIDKDSWTATIEAGSPGPKLEDDLQALGYSLGHMPDSFEFATLGGWLATRSAGMQSDAYGKIEDMVVALKMVSPAGTLSTKLTPKSSAGPDLDQVVVGSEGVLGIITEATMKVHPVPQVKDYHGVLFPDFESGAAAIHDAICRNASPTMFRLQDADETGLAFSMKAPSTGFSGFIQAQVKKYLKAKGYTQPCLMMAGFEGDPDYTREMLRKVLPIVKKHRGFHLGNSVGKTWAKNKFAVPYLRDILMNHGCMVDVAETAAVWSKLLPLYHGARNAVREQFRKEGYPGYIGCHISHSYVDGASLYFTFAAQQVPGQEIEQYFRFKRLITEAFLEHGGTLTHHHAVGYEHRPWMEREVTRPGLTLLRGMKQALDPDGIMNPGKLISPGPSEKYAATPASTTPYTEKTSSSEAGAGHS